MEFFQNCLKRIEMWAELCLRKKENDGSADNIPQLKVSVSFSVEHKEPEIPPLQGDYTKAVFLWAFSRPAPIRKADGYAAYFLYECGIRDCIKYHQDMIQDGYLIEAEPVEVLNSFRIPELKEMLKELNQPVSGKKALLINRILEFSGDDFLGLHCPEKLYKPSMKGLSFLEKHEDYVQVHRHKNWGVSWEEYDRYAKCDQDYLSTMWVIFNDHLKKASLLESRNLYYCLYSVLMEQGKRSDALEMLLKVFYLDLSGVEVQSLLHLYQERFYTKKGLREYFNVAVMLPPGNVAALEKFQDIYDSEMIDQLYMWKLPVQICDKKLFREIIESAIDGLVEREHANEKLKTAYDKFIDEL
jgi:hypothetical protein